MEKTIEETHKEKHRWWHWLFVVWRLTEDNWCGKETDYFECNWPGCRYEKKITRAYDFK